jgi:hypothetical protein
MSNLMMGITFALSPVIFFDFGQFTSNNELN